MHSISIAPTVKEKCPDLVLGAIQCELIVTTNYSQLLDLIEKELSELQSNLAVEDIAKTPPIQSSRKGYKALGKDPARYRLSAEALLRRIVKGKGLYHVNNVVDLLNLVSAKTGYSIGGYDANKIQSSIQLSIGRQHEPYQGIGRGDLNIEFLPVFRDQLGAFGSPTSDSTRTMVTPETRTFLMIIFNFGAHDDLEKTMAEAIDLLEKFAEAKNIAQQIIS